MGMDGWMKTGTQGENRGETGQAVAPHGAHTHAPTHTLAQTQGTQTARGGKERENEKGAGMEE